MWYLVLSLPRWRHCLNGPPYPKHCLNSDPLGILLFFKSCLSHWRPEPCLPHYPRFSASLGGTGAQIWIGESLPGLAWLGIFSVSAGVMVLSQGIFKAEVPKLSMVAAVIVAAIVAAYSLVDGVGVRLSDSTMGYIAWLFIAEAFVALFIFKTQWQRLRMMPLKPCLLGFLGGILSATAYALVLYAKTEAPLGVVSALRETSVIFAALIGVFWFGEGPKTRRLLAGMIVAFGTIMIGLAH